MQWRCFAAPLLLALLTGRAQGVVPPNLSLETIPVGYFGGARFAPRPKSELEVLAKMRVIIIEKWEGPCWYECSVNKSQGTPCSASCGAEDYQLDTIRAVKARNPAVAAVFYLNSLYNFEMYRLEGQFAAANENMRDVNGKIIGLEQDGGMTNCPVYDFANHSAVERFLSFQRTLVDAGVDGLFPDKADVRAMENTSAGFWQICENPHGHTPGTSHKWADMCAVISHSQAMEYNAGKQAIFDGMFSIYGSDGMVFANSTAMVTLGTSTTLSKFMSVIEQRFKPGRWPRSGFRYVYVQTKDRDEQDPAQPLESACTDRELAFFLLMLRSGMILGCSGWDPIFERPLGDPVGPAKQTADGVWHRQFAHGLALSYDPATDKVKFDWPKRSEVLGLHRQDADASGLDGPRWSRVPAAVCDSWGKDPYCGKVCHGDADCNQADGCMVCQHNKSAGHNNCVTRNSNCGGLPAPPDPKGPKKQYLAIGDSITYGAFPYVQKRLAETVDSHLCSRNAGPTGEGEKCDAVWVGPDLERWDVISYNFGAWDTARQKGCSSPERHQKGSCNDTARIEEYVENLRNITEFLMTTRAGKTGGLIYVLTTPSADTRDTKTNTTNCCYEGQLPAPGNLGTLSCPSLIRRYNAAASHLLSTEFPSVVIDNMWAWVNLHCCGSEDCSYDYCDFQPYHIACNVHFDGGDGWDYLAKNLSATVKSVLRHASSVPAH